MDTSTQNIAASLWARARGPGMDGTADQVLLRQAATRLRELDAAVAAMWQPIADASDGVDVLIQIPERDALTKKPMAPTLLVARIATHPDSGAPMGWEVATEGGDHEPLEGDEPDAFLPLRALRRVTP